MTKKGKGKRAASPTRPIPVLRMRLSNSNQAAVQLRINELEASCSDPTMLWPTAITAAAATAATTAATAAAATVNGGHRLIAGLDWATNEDESLVTANRIVAEQGADVRNQARQRAQIRDDCVMAAEVDGMTNGEAQSLQDAATAATVANMTDDQVASRLPSQPRPATSPTSRGAGCSHDSCKNGGTTTAGEAYEPLDLQMRKLHRKDSRSQGRHLGCCDGATGFLDSVNGHRPGCAGQASPAEAQPMFGDTHGLRCFMITVNANGVHVPNGGADGQSADWLQSVQGFHDRTTGIGNSTGVEEIGKNKKLRHLHFLVWMQMEDTQAHRNKYAKLIRTALGMGAGPGLTQGKVRYFCGPGLNFKFPFFTCFWIAALQLFLDPLFC